MHVPLVAIFDFDGTLVDSDVALTAPFLELGVTEAALPPLGLPLVEACARVGVTVEDYVDRYDESVVQPFPGVEGVLARLPRWGLASNKKRRAGHRELRRLGWSPAVALFSDDFGETEKCLDPVLAALDLAPDAAIYVGDTGHDRACAAAAGVRFAVAGWNPRARTGAHAGDVVLDHPTQVLDLLAGVG